MVYWTPSMVKIKGWAELVLWGFHSAQPSTAFQARLPPRVASGSVSVSFKMHFHNGAARMGIGDGDVGTGSAPERQSETSLGWPLLALRFKSYCRIPLRARTTFSLPWETAKVISKKLKIHNSVSNEIVITRNLWFSILWSISRFKSQSLSLEGWSPDPVSLTSWLCNPGEIT